MFAGKMNSKKDVQMKQRIVLAFVFADPAPIL